MLFNISINNRSNTGSYDYNNNVSSPASSNSYSPSNFGQPSIPQTNQAESSSFFGNLFDGVGDLFGGVKSFGVDLFNGGTNAIKGIGHNLFEAAGDFGRGVVDIFSGNFGEGFIGIGKSLGKATIQTPVDATITALGSPLLGIGAKSESLSPENKELAQSIFGDSVDLDAVRIKKLPKLSSAVINNFASAFVLGNDIIVPGDSNIDTNKGLLIHELSHVWQHQNGGTDYISEALYAQHFGEGYDFGKAIEDGKTFGEFNPEQQAEFISKIALSGVDVDSKDPIYAFEGYREGNFVNYHIKQYAKDSFENNHYSRLSKTSEGPIEINKNVIIDAFKNVISGKETP